MNLKSSDIVKLLGLIELPEEGGYYSRTYQSPESVELPRGNRALGDAIYYLITEDQFSGLHKLKCDEMWHFYEGHPLEICFIDAEAKLNFIKLGRDFEKGEVLQAVVPANCWFGSYLTEGSDYALVGCTVSPGFDFQDFEMPDRNELLKLYPEFSDIILKLTH